MTYPPRGVRCAFALVEVIVSLAVILILAAVAMPQLSGYLDRKRIEAAAAQLAMIRDALYKPESTTAFYQVIGSNAGRLSQLANPLGGADRDSCNTTFTLAERNSWGNGGPYVNFMIGASGMATPLGQTDDLLTRTPANGGGTSGTLRITWSNNVSLADAQELDLFVDGVSGWNSGTVQWTPQNGNNGVVTLHYFVLINGVC